MNGVSDKRVEFLDKIKTLLFHLLTNIKKRLQMNMYKIPRGKMMFLVG